MIDVIFSSSSFIIFFGLVHYFILKLYATTRYNCSSTHYSKHSLHTMSSCSNLSERLTYYERSTRNRLERALRMMDARRIPGSTVERHAPLVPPLSSSRRSDWLTHSHMPSSLMSTNIDSSASRDSSQENSLPLLLPVPPSLSRIPPSDSATTREVSSTTRIVDRVRSFLDNIDDQLSNDGMYPVYSEVCTLYSEVCTLYSEVCTLYIVRYVLCIVRYVLSV